MWRTSDFDADGNWRERGRRVERLKNNRRDREIFFMIPLAQLSTLYSREFHASSGRPGSPEDWAI
jgi:hypothetical protein